jgi:hypothetical protein
MGMEQARLARLVAPPGSAGRRDARGDALAAARAGGRHEALCRRRDLSPRPAREPNAPPIPVGRAARLTPRSAGTPFASCVGRQTPGSRRGAMDVRRRGANRVSRVGAGRGNDRRGRVGVLAWDVGDGLEPRGGVRPRGGRPRETRRRAALACLRGSRRRRRRARLPTNQRRPRSNSLAQRGRSTPRLAVRRVRRPLVHRVGGGGEDTRTRRTRWRRLPGVSRRGARGRNPSFQASSWPSRRFALDALPRSDARGVARPAPRRHVGEARAGMPRRRPSPDVGRRIIIHIAPRRGR